MAYYRLMILFRMCRRANSCLQVCTSSGGGGEIIYSLSSHFFPHLLCPPKLFSKRFLWFCVKRARGHDDTTANEVKQTCIHAQRELRHACIVDTIVTRVRSHPRSEVYGKKRLAVNPSLLRNKNRNDIGFEA